MKNKVIEVILIFCYLYINSEIVCSQKHNIRTNNRPNSRSYRSNSDPTILKVYPSSANDQNYEDAGVPPGALPNVSPDVAPDVLPDIPPQSTNSEPKVDEDYNPGDPPLKEDSNDSEKDIKNYSDESIGANGCICVPYYQCDDGNIITDGSGIIDPRKIKPSKKEIPLESNYKPPFCGTFHVCCSDPSEETTEKPYIHRCGIRNPSGINRRILSPSNVKSATEFGEWPWTAAILKFENGANLFQCGGVLIDHSHILTVAHCVSTFTHNNEYKLLVRLGEWDTQKTTEFLPHEDYKVVSIAIHSSFRNGSLWNDIALLKLNRKVQFKPHIDSICLPTYKETFDGMNCVTTGWGKDAYSKQLFDFNRKDGLVFHFSEST